MKSSSEWREVAESFMQLCPAVMQGWKNKREQRVAQEHKAAEEESGIEKEDVTESNE